MGSRPRLLAGRAGRSPRFCLPLLLAGSSRHARTCGAAVWSSTLWTVQGRSTTSPPRNAWSEGGDEVGEGGGCNRRAEGLQVGEQAGCWLATHRGGKRSCIPADRGCTRGCAARLHLAHIFVWSSWRRRQREEPLGCKLRRAMELAVQKQGEEYRRSTAPECSLCSAPGEKLCAAAAAGQPDNHCRACTPTSAAPSPCLRRFAQTAAQAAGPPAAGPGLQVDRHEPSLPQLCSDFLAGRSSGPPKNFAESPSGGAQFRWGRAASRHPKHQHCRCMGALCGMAWLRRQAARGGPRL